MNRHKKIINTILSCSPVNYSISIKISATTVQLHNDVYLVHA